MAEKPNKDPNAAPITDNYQVETGRSERHVWLMKCPPVVTQAMQNTNRHTQLLPSDASAGPIVAKVIVAVDPLRPNDDSSSTQVECVYIHAENVSVSVLDFFRALLE